MDVADGVARQPHPAAAAGDLFTRDRRRHPAALVAIHSLKASVQTGIATQAKSLLGSDVQVSSRQPFTKEEEAKLAAQATRVSHETGFSSTLYFATANAAPAAPVRGLDGDYPYYGQVQTTPADAWQRLRTEPGILLEPALLDQFRARVGDKVKLGSIELPILGVVNKPCAAQQPVQRLRAGGLRAPRGPDPHRPARHHQPRLPPSPPRTPGRSRLA